MSEFSDTKFSHWSTAIQRCEAHGKGYVIATIINTQGSTPRASGSKMVIDAQYTYDSIGGGQLEFLVVQHARAMLADNQDCQLFKPFPLAAEAGQCCGGNVSVMLEAFAARDWQIVLFGAGHVCRALIGILAELPCQVSILDNRPDFSPRGLPRNCRYQYYTDPIAAVTNLPERSWIAIFTHDHALDFALCSACLQQNRWRYLGLIGSQTKALRFRKRLALAGFSADSIAQMHCPIGLAEVKGKRPMEVAVAIAAQLQSLYYPAESANSSRSTSWRQIKTILQQTAASASAHSCEHKL